jgi:ankyrin repeat protein
MSGSRVAEQAAFVSAVLSGDVEHVRHAIESNTIDVDQCLATFESVPPLLLAAESGRAPIVQLLLDCGARIDQTDSTGSTALMHACTNGHTDVVALLIARNASLDSALRCAIAPRREPILRMLIEAGVPLDSRDYVCRAAILSAAIVGALVDRGVVIGELRTGDGSTPCHLVASHDDLDMLKLFVEQHGVDVNALDIVRRTCLHIAANCGQHEQVRWLVNAGADIECVDMSGRTPLFGACGHEDLDGALALIAVGANVHQRDTDSCTPLHYLATHSRRPSSIIVRMKLAALLAAGGDFDARNDKGETPRMLANARGFSTPSASEIDLARRQISAAQLAFVRERAFAVCVGLQPLQLDALQMCEILLHACAYSSPVSLSIPFHRWWQLATTVKHFVQR